MVNTYSSNYSRRKSYGKSSVPVRYRGLGRYARKAVSATNARITKPMVSVVKAISKDQHLRTLETKQVLYNGATQGVASGSNQNTTAFNVFWPWGNGDFANRVDGASIHTMELNVNYYFYRNSTTADASPITARVTLLKTGTEWTLGTGSAPFVPESNIPAEV